MAQVVIFAPAGEDVSAGKEALEGAGHDVEIVEATAENLLHMAIGMLEGTGGTGGEKPKKEKEESTPAEEEAEGGEETPAEETPPEEEEVTEEGLSVNDETIPVVVSATSKFSLLQAVTAVSDNDPGRVQFSLNESRFTAWKTNNMVSVVVAAGGKTVNVAAQVVEAKSPKLVLCKADAKRLGLK